jgi:hypothetical protein
VRASCEIDPAQVDQDDRRLAGALTSVAAVASLLLARAGATHNRALSVGWRTGAKRSMPTTIESVVRVQSALKARCKSARGRPKTPRPATGRSELARTFLPDSLDETLMTHTLCLYSTGQHA